MRLRKIDLDKFTSIQDGTRILVAIWIPHDDRNEMYTGTICGDLINYDDGKTDFKGILVSYMKNGYAKVYVLEV